MDTKILKKVAAELNEVLGLVDDDGNPGIDINLPKKKLLAKIEEAAELIEEPDMDEFSEETLSFLNEHVFHQKDEGADDGEGADDVDADDVDADDGEGADDVDADDVDADDVDADDVDADDGEGADEEEKSKPKPKASAKEKPKASAKEKPKPKEKPKASAKEKPKPKEKKTEEAYTRFDSVAEALKMVGVWPKDNEAVKSLAKAADELYAMSKGKSNVKESLWATRTALRVMEAFNVFKVMESLLINKHE